MLKSSSETVLITDVDNYTSLIHNDVPVQSLLWVLAVLEVQALHVVPVVPAAQDLRTVQVDQALHGHLVVPALLKVLEVLAFRHFQALPVLHEVLGVLVVPVLLSVPGVLLHRVVLEVHPLQFHHVVPFSLGNKTSGVTDSHSIVYFY